MSREEELDNAGTALIIVGVAILAYGIWNGQLTANLVDAATSIIGLGIAAIAGGGVLKAVAKEVV